MQRTPNQTDGQPANPRVSLSIRITMLEFSLQPSAAPRTVLLLGAHCDDL
jgi:hypothetical protein